MNDNKSKRLIITFCYIHHVAEGFFVIKINERGEGQMNSSGYIRGLYSKNSGRDQFLQTVLQVIERQMAKWDSKSEVTYHLDKDNYKITFQFKGKTYEISLKFETISHLQHKSPYALDRHIWHTLEKQGLIIRYSTGNYLSYVLH